MSALHNKFMNTTHPSLFTLSLLTNLVLLACPMHIQAQQDSNTQQNSTSLESAVEHVYDRICGSGAWSKVPAPNKTNILNLINKETQPMEHIKSIVLTYIICQIRNKTFDSNSYTDCSHIINTLNADITQAELEKILSEEKK